MKDTFEEIFVHHTSATLKGYKAGSLFSHRPSCVVMFREKLRTLDQALHKKGVQIHMIDRNSGSMLIFVYRPKLIEAMLSQPELQCFLCELGYPVNKGYEANVEHLLKKLTEYDDFPHEIGLFLGYPLDDVLGFITNKGKNFAFSGLWKVYSQPDIAKERFELFQRCREHCLECLREGQSVLQIVHAA
ncbi:MAG TPA: DUF3793 family protein [Clostridiaceae bacterium]|nr:DUF3793 family protein [Clostridiaceae bacterium]